jgi:hypothetical protein
MVRWAYLLTAFVALAAWAGAQGPVPPAALSAEDRLRLLKTNGALIDELVRDGVEMSKPGNPVQKAERCRSASVSLANAIRQAATAEDAERIVELTGLFREFVRDGLAPTITEAQRGVPLDSPSGRQLRDLRDTVAKDVTSLKAAIPATGKVGDNPRVQDALKQLDELAETLK